DLLVRRQDVRRAIDHLTSRGYEPKRYDLDFGSLEETINRSNGCGFLKKGAADIDLHWHVLHDCLEDWSDEAFWDRSALRDRQGLGVRMLCPEDTLLHICAHGMKYNELPPLRWLVDAAMVLRSSGDTLDVDHLHRAAERRAL